MALEFQIFVDLRREIDRASQCVSLKSDSSFLTRRSSTTIDACIFI